MDYFTDIQKPTLILSEERARANIGHMAEKARANGVRFRPHFKTHQSATIGEWFWAAGVNRISVSSVDMAVYFALHGWDDITIALPVNLRQIESLTSLARTVHLGVLIESPESAAVLRQRMSGFADVWLKIDVGAHRTGLPWDQPETVRSVIAEVQRAPNQALRGLLTHAGHTYQAGSVSEVDQIYQRSRQRLNLLRNALGAGELEISVGDTPGCSIVEDLSGVDEIRPGNFIFYDAEQFLLGSCTWNQIAVAVACPIVALHPEREEVVIYGGAIHLSKDFLSYDNHPAYGLVALPDGNGWGEMIQAAYVRSLSQEHGVIHMPAEPLSHLLVGDLLFVVPAHSCLTVSALGRFRTLEGQVITTMNVEP
jgi:D-serine deaminase-like pyridoxal phosphate-dependent protein